MRTHRIRRPGTKAGAALAVVALAISGCGSAGSANDSGDGAEDVDFSGEVITLLTPWAPGSASDILARLLADNLGNYLPGEPTLVVENKDGAGGVTGTNEVYNSGTTDGTLAVVTSVALWNELIETEGVTYSMEDFNTVAILGEPEVHYVGTQTGIETAADLVGYDETIQAGGLAPNNSKTVLSRAAADVFGVDLQVVLGFPGSAEPRQAIVAGDIDYYMDTVGGFFGGGVADGVGTDYVPLFQGGLPGPDGELVRDDRLEEYDIPTFREVVIENLGEDGLDTTAFKAFEAASATYAAIRSVMLPPETEPAIVEAWNDALAEMFSDEDFIAASTELGGYPVQATIGEDAQEVIADVRASFNDDPEVAEAVIGYTGEE